MCYTNQAKGGKMAEKTIAAISTPNGVGGIAIVRMSGPKALDIAYEVFSCSRPKDKVIPRTLYLGEFTASDIKEKCLMVYFKAPYSYTGEDIVEFQCHGGMVIAKQILETLLSHGCTMAEAGEFTKRAFLNGKTTLDEAEGVIDMINAESESEVRAGYNLLSGHLAQKVKTMQDNITEILAKVNVVMDYPDEDVEDDAKIDLETTISDLQNQINNLLETSKTGMVIKNGCRVALVGKPNAGKSSLMNAMLHYNRAIVTDIKGTTRDTIEETYVYNGVKFILIDTAGVRQSNDAVEKIGIAKSIDEIKSADIVLFLLDSTTPITDEDKYIFNLVCDKNYIIVVNKQDICDNIDINTLGNVKDVIYISATQEQNIDKLKQKIYSKVISEQNTKDSLMITNIRHVEILRQAKEMCDKIKNAIMSGVTLDIISIDLTNLWNKIGEITGNTNNGEIIDKIFEKFCVGK